MKGLTYSQRLNETQKFFKNWNIQIPVGGGLIELIVVRDTRGMNNSLYENSYGYYPSSLYLLIMQGGQTGTLNRLMGLCQFESGPCEG